MNYHSEQEFVNEFDLTALDTVVLGKGGFGKVYKCKSKNENKFYALKV